MNQVDVFDIFKEMNRLDCDDSKARLRVSNIMLSADAKKKDGNVKMWIEPSIVTQLALGTHTPLLLILNKEEYQSVKSYLESIQQ